MPRSLPSQPLLDPVTGGLAYILYRSIQMSIGILCVLVTFECLLAAGWLWCMRYSAKVSGAPCAMRHKPCSLWSPRSCEYYPLIAARRTQLCTWMTLLLIPLNLVMFGAWALRVQSSATVRRSMHVLRDIRGRLEC